MYKAFSLLFGLYRSLLIVRSQYGKLDDGARFHVFSHLILETVIYGKSMLVTNILGRDDSVEVKNNKETGFILSFIQKDRVLAAVCFLPFSCFVCNCFVVMYRMKIHHIEDVSIFIQLINSADCTPS